MEMGELSPERSSNSYSESIPCLQGETSLFVTKEEASINQLKDAETHWMSSELSRKNMILLNRSGGVC